MQLDDHQKSVLKRMLEPSCPNVFIIWAKMGTGKTRIALVAFEQSGFTDLLCVVRRVSFDTWIEEIEKCNLDFTIYENNYEMKNMRRLGHAKSKRVLLLSGSDLKNRPAKFPLGQMMVVDELYLFSNPDSQRSKALQNFSLSCRVRLGLSGTIMPSQDNLTIFGQFKALNAQHILASGTTEFRYKYQESFHNGYGKAWQNKDNSVEKLKALVAPFVDIYMPEGRPSRTMIVKVKANDFQKREIKVLKETYRDSQGKDYKWALQIINVINGISNGWYQGEDEYIEHPSEKVDKLLAMLEELVSANHKVVVWCQYHNDISRIYPQLKWPWIEFTGLSTFNMEAWNSGKFPIVLATVANGASVNYFKDVEYAIYFSIGYKWLDLEQSMMRHERKDSSHGGPQYYFLQTQGTGDARAYQLVTSAKMAEKELIETLCKELMNT